MVAGEHPTRIACAIALLLKTSVLAVRWNIRARCSCGRASDAARAAGFAAVASAGQPPAAALAPQLLLCTCIHAIGGLIVALLRARKYAHLSDKYAEHNENARTHGFFADLSPHAAPLVDL